MLSSSQLKLNQRILVRLAGQSRGLTLEQAAGHADEDADPRMAHWAAIELQRAGLIEAGEAGQFHITPTGAALSGASSAETETEVELLSAAAAAQTDLEGRLLGQVHHLHPTAFEGLIIDVLLGMGYGAGRPDLARRLGRSGDGGIDGIIDLDELGLDAIYVQAKRYRPLDAIPVSAVRDFAGSLDAVRASRGVLFTTARLTPACHEFARQSTRRIVLVDGARLVRLMIRHGIGVRQRATVVFRELDEAYFLALADTTGLRRPDISSASIQPRK